MIWLNFTKGNENDQRKSPKLWKPRPKFPGLFQTERVPRNLEPSEYFSYCVKEKSQSKPMRFFVNLTCELSRKLRKNPQKKMKTRENMQNRVHPPKTSPIEQITDRWEPKNSNLQRVTLQCLTSCYRWSNLLRENVSNLALASAQNQPKIWKYAWKILIFLL